MMKILEFNYVINVYGIIDYKKVIILYIHYKYEYNKMCMLEMIKITDLLLQNTQNKNKEYHGM